MIDTGGPAALWATVPGQDEGVTTGTSWTGTCQSRGLGVLGTGAGLILVGVGVAVLIAVPQPVLGGVLLAAGAAVALSAWWTSRLRVEVTPTALVVAWGPTGWPRKRVAWDRVGAVSALQVDPTSWGGWGYRWVPWAHASAAVVRRGPGIRLDLTDDRVFVVTVDDAVAGAQAAAAARRVALRAAP